MRKFLLIVACAFSFCVRSQDTNLVEIVDRQMNIIQAQNVLLNSIYGLFSHGFDYSYFDTLPDGSFYQEDGTDPFNNVFWYSQYNISQVARLLHLIFSGSLDNEYDTSTNNILAYASSLRNHNADVRELLSSIESDVNSIAFTVGGFPSRFVRQYDLINTFRSDYTNNFERLYEVITNMDFKVSISNQIEISNILSDGMREITGQQEWTRDNIQSEMWNWRDNMNRNHGELMEFLHTMSNSVLFASNVLNCCCGMNSNNQEVVSNYQDSVLAMLNWMTNNFPDVAESPIGGGGGSNNVWSIWRPSGVPPSGWFHLFVPTVEWVQSGNDSQQFKPRYGNYQYDSVYNAVWDEYDNLLQNFKSNGIDGQRFLAGLVDLQLHIMANMSTQLYMIDSKMPTKTNLWSWIEEYKSKVSDEVVNAQRENSEIVSSVSALLDYTPFSMVGGHFPKVSNALSSLKIQEDSSPVLRIPIPRALRVSDSDELVVDVRNSDWFSSGRDWCRWMFTFIWGWLFIRIGLVPIFYVFFYTLRIAEIAAHLVLMGSVRGSSGVVSSFGASAVDLVLSLLGIDTDFKRFVWGIMRD